MVRAPGKRREPTVTFAEDTRAVLLAREGAALGGNERIDVARAELVRIRIDDDASGRSRRHVDRSDERSNEQHLGEHACSGAS